MSEEKDGIVNIRHKGESYAVPTSEIDGFLTRKPESEIEDSKSFEIYKGYVQGKAAQQTLYSGVKQAGIPFNNDIVTLPNTPFNPQQNSHSPLLHPKNLKQGQQT